MKKNLFLLRNSVKNISRYKSRYILFGVMFFITVVALSVSLSVFFNSGEALEAYKKEFFGTYNVWNTPQTPSGISVAVFEKEYYLPVLDNQYVEQLSFVNYRFSTALIKGAEYTTPNYRLSPEILIKDPKATPPPPPAYLSVELRTQDGIKSLNNLFYNPAYVIGLNFEELPLAHKREFVLSEGRMYENDDECIIAVSSKISGEEWNLLAAGDIIAMRTGENTYKEFTIVGILQDNRSLNANDQTRILFTTFDGALFFKSSITAPGFLADPGAMYPTRSGKVNTPIDFTLNALPVVNRPASSSAPASYSVFEGFDVRVRLEDYGNSEAFFAETKEDGYVVNSLFTDEINRSIYRVLASSQSQSSMFMVVIAVFIVTVTMIMTVIILNNRKYEIAVLRSVGMKKSRLIISYLAENLAFIWGIAVVSLVSAQAVYYLFLDRGLKVNVDMKFMPDSPLPLILQNVGITFGGVTAVAVLSLIFAAVYIVRFEPLKIFNKQY